MNENADTVRRVIVIASSAGGINALTQVLRRMPGDIPVAVLCVQHLRSSHPTRLPEHLARNSYLRVVLVENGTPLQAGLAYVAMPGKHLYIEDGHLALNLDEPVNYVRPSEDVLFASASQAYGPNVIGVVLSGSGRDGAHGCQLIKANGGITIAQDEKTSAYFAMPKAAIDAGAIDYVLPINEISQKITDLVKPE